MACTFALENALRREGYGRIAGVDEAGRGPLAGPVVVAAVVLPERWPPRGWPRGVRLDDSKRLNAAQREAAFMAVRRVAVGWRVRVVPHGVIDRLNILGATLLGMAEAVERLQPAADYVLVDGNRPPTLAVPCRAVVGGDARSRSIAAASVLAKVVRDRLMAVYDRRYPGWGFAEHKGYGTAGHRAALQRLGPSPIHRRSFTFRDGAWQLALALEEEPPAGTDA